MRKSETGLAEPQVDLSGLVERVEKLESQNRPWKLGSILAALVLALSVAASTRARQEHDQPLRAKTIEAETLLLKDSDGVTRGEWKVTNGVPVLQLYNANGKVLWSTTPSFLIQAR